MALGVEPFLHSCPARQGHGQQEGTTDMAEFRGVDFYGIEALLSEEEKLARDSVRQYVEDNVIPIVDDFYERGTFPMDLVRPLAELGVFGANLPTEYGCAGMNNVAYGLIMQELERGDSGLRSFVSVQGGLVMYPIFTFGSEEQRQSGCRSSRAARRSAASA